MYLPVVLVVVVVVVVVVVFVVVVIVVIVVVVVTNFVYSHTQKYCGHQHLSRRACLSWGAASYLLLEFSYLGAWEPFWATDGARGLVTGHCKNKQQPYRGRICSKTAHRQETCGTHAAQIFQG